MKLEDNELNHILNYYKVKKVKKFYVGYDKLYPLFNLHK